MNDSKFQVLFNFKALEALLFNRTNTNLKDWKKRIAQELKSFSVKIDPESHLKTLQSMRSDTVTVKIPREVLFVLNLCAVLMFKCHSFNVVMDALELYELPQPLKPLEHFVEFDKLCAEHFESSMNTKSCIENAEIAMKICFGSKMTKNQKNLAKCVLVLGMSTIFNQENVSELLDVLSALCVDKNTHKKFYLMYGPGNTGKSLFSKIIMGMGAPFAQQHNNLTKASDRSTVTTTNTVVVINEVGNLNGDLVKTITGNDAVSGQIFFKQNFALRQSQALLYGATKSYITFESNPNLNVEKTTVNRFHAINLKGVQIMDKVQVPSLIAMMGKNIYRRDTVQIESDELAKYVTCMAYMSYARRRDVSFNSPINENNEFAIRYQNAVFNKNNATSKFLTEIGYVRANHFYIKKEKFLRHIREVYDSSATGNTSFKKIETYAAFLSAFENYYAEPIQGLDVLHNIQKGTFVDNVKLNMMVGRRPNSQITNFDLEKQVELYSDVDDQSNAKIYFQTVNIYYLKNKVYQGIYFVNAPLDYMGNNYFDIQDINLPEWNTDNVPTMVEEKRNDKRRKRPRSKSLVESTSEDEDCEEPKKKKTRDRDTHTSDDEHESMLVEKKQNDKRRKRPRSKSLAEPTSEDEVCEEPKKKKTDVRKVNTSDDKLDKTSKVPVLDEQEASHCSLVDTEIVEDIVYEKTKKFNYIPDDVSNEKTRKMFATLVSDSEDEVDETTEELDEKKTSLKDLDHDINEIMLPSSEW